MSFRAVSIARIKDQEVSLALDSIGEVIEQITSKNLLDGRLIEGIVVTAGTVKVVDHGLERGYRGWVVVKQNANSNIWESTPNLPTLQIRLNASVNVTISLWVF